jgi:hypothetical protein
VAGGRAADGGLGGCVRLQGTVYDYFVDEAQCLMVPWEERVTKFDYTPGEGMGGGGALAAAEGPGEGEGGGSCGSCAAFH